MKQYFDYLSITIVILAMCMSLFGQDPCFLPILAGVIGLLYLIYCITLFLFRRPKFDWHLINGNYLCKVIVLVLATPFIISLFVDKNTLSPEELIYEDELYAKKTSNVSVEEEPSIYWGIYYHFIDPGNQHATTSEEGRKLAFVIALLGVFLLNGLLVSSIIGWIDSRKERWLKGEVRYNGILKMRSHYVVIGGNDMVSGIVEQLLRKDDGLFGFCKPYILVQTSRDVDVFRRELFSSLTKSQQKRVIVYYGNRTSNVDIHDLCLNQALEVYVLGEESRVDDIESYHDTMNMQCLKLISTDVGRIAKFKKDNHSDRRLVCRVMFEYQTSFNLFQVTDIDGDKIKFLPFNYYENWAQNVLVCQELQDVSKCKYLPLEGFDGIKSGDSTQVHLVIVGMSPMGIALGIEAAHLCHYPNYETGKIRTKITFIDTNAGEEKDFFKGRFQELLSLSHWSYDRFSDEGLVWKEKYKPCVNEHLGGDFVDVEWEFINGSIESPGIRQYFSDVTADDRVKLTIAVCIPENSAAIAAAAYLPDSVYQSKNTLQVLVYQRMNDELLRQINDNNKRYHGKMKAFGMARDCYHSDLEELSESIGKEINRVYEEFKERAGASKKVTVYVPEKNDISKPKSAKMWSNKYNIYSMWSKYRCITTSDGHVFNPLKEDFDGVDSKMMDELGKVEHNRWVVEQLLLRYRPLTLEEQENAKIVAKDSSDAQKNELKSQYAHLDICSNVRLNEVDYNMSELDKALIAVLPSAYREYVNAKK